ncbi:hypothetical protein [Methylobacterium sp. SyP6R]|uniref:hypothetical protein n=1 Tax=Methylobacterium sp. SyP6R TaxID=2718876 RepID=UPI001F3E92AC|nr:hypothetical protein [Methylobacterium sp. SyP6R]MCF4129542.1 hypothetical protein [Methylobacterium sp. SyP6R]
MGHFRRYGQPLDRAHAVEGGQRLREVARTDHVDPGQARQQGGIEALPLETEMHAGMPEHGGRRDEILPRQERGDAAELAVDLWLRPGSPDEVGRAAGLLERPAQLRLVMGSIAEPDLPDVGERPGWDMGEVTRNVMATVDHHRP